MISNNNKRTLLTKAVALAIAGASSQFVITSASAESVDALVLEEVVVTAQKRSESLQDVPVAITALGAGALEEGLIGGVMDIASRVPGMSAPVFNDSQPQIYIRGIGSNIDGAASDPAVGVFIDDVYIARTSGAMMDIFDLERVEVLRGPQGTLFGKNVVGGAMHYVTAKPTEEFSASAEASLGNYDYQKVRGKVNGAVAEDWAGSFSFSTRRRDGYIDNQVTGSDLRQIDSQSYRGKLLYQGSDTFEALLSADYTKSDTLGSSREFIGGVFGVGNSRDPYKVEQDDDGFANSEIWGVSLKADWDLEDVTLTSITGYRESKSANQVAAFGRRLDHGGSGSNHYIEESEQFSQEFRLASQSVGDYRWLMGAYYFSENVDRMEEFANVFFHPGLMDFVGQLDRDTAYNKTETYALFAQGTYDISNELSITAGLRRTWESKDFSSVGESEGPAGVFSVPAGFLDWPGVVEFDIETDESWANTTASASINYAFNDDVNLYLAFAQGFKSGGYQSNGSSAVHASTPYDPEYADMWELGVKSQLFDGRVRLNVAIFDMAYDDLQVLQTVQLDPTPGALPVNLISNAAEATSRGVEVEFTWLVTEALEISGWYAYLDATYDDYIDSNNNDNSGNMLTRSPKNSYNIAMKYVVDVADWGEVNFGLDYRNVSKAYMDQDNNDMAVIPDYELLDARVAWIPQAGDMEIAFAVKNLTDETYLEHSFDLEAPVGTALNAVGAPRTYSLTFRKDF